MDEPSAFTLAVRYIEIVILALILPQALGLFGLYRSRGKRRIVKAIAVLIGPLTYFITASIYWEVQARAIIASRYRPCGVFGASAVLSTMFGTLIHFILSAIILFAMIFL